MKAQGRMQNGLGVFDEEEAGGAFVEWDYLMIRINDADSEIEARLNIDDGHSRRSLSRHHQLKKRKKQIIRVLSGLRGMF